MIKQTLAALAFVGLYAQPAAALMVNTGDVIRGAYSFPAFGATDFNPTAFLLRLTSPDLFGGADSVGVTYRDASLSALSFTRFDASGSALDPTVGFMFSSSDFLTGVSSVPQNGFVDITGLAGSFNVAAIDLFAIEPVGTGILRQNRVTEFTSVVEPPSAIPLPAAGWLLISGLATLLIARRSRPISPQ